MSLPGRLAGVLSKLVVVFVFACTAGVVAWFSLVYTVHLGTVAVPELRGATQAEADLSAHDLGLLMVVDEAGAFSDTIPVGHVAHQKPLPGFHLKAGSTVHVRLSLGDEQTLVPAVYGDSLQAAIRTLEEIILSCLEKDADRRPQSARDLARALRSCRVAEGWTGERAARWWQTNSPPEAVPDRPAPVRDDSPTLIGRRLIEQPAAGH